MLGHATGKSSSFKLAWIGGQYELIHPWGYAMADKCNESSYVLSLVDKLALTSLIVVL